MLCGLEDDASLVANGFLEGNSINELLEIYLMDLIGPHAYDKCGAEFPLLIKKLTVNGFLSVQVHPDDQIAEKRHNAYGKTEIWYVMDAGDDALLYLGFNRDLTERELQLRCLNDTLPEVMNCIHPKKGECYFIPAGMAHACGGGLTIAEVQQVSDITYRIYDWGREHNPQTERPMHLNLALDCIDLDACNPTPTTDGTLANCPYFTAVYKEITAPVECDGMETDGFLIYLCLEGSVEVVCENKTAVLQRGDCLLVPDAVKQWTLLPKGKAVLMEVTQPD